MRRTFICMTGCVSFLILSSCRKGPAAITKQFLNDIHDGNFSGPNVLPDPKLPAGSTSLSRIIRLSLKEENGSSAR
ncbi:hypothetical protein SAMN05216464_118131 [Mucilaginibacter pineti]|uniref:Uncharacterized protein n=1 Tax=Mucilaginibacter pineti TaxID=1391627 RepID=A0A1G7LF46_9SPHI|nr:hypothetical protein [Mucilaginibacter pineti]SDF47650.1 hypothetical protein SAMN05216464_118131 [Mucilaginibacter pineti]